tara:strand:- start:596 stop:1414 length:819 start_codon:yes stop_codon:yes gene_type:complete
MKPFKTSNLLIKTFALLSLLSGSFVLLNQKEVKANCLDEFGSNPSSMTDSCEITPERYLIRVYEMGFCTTDPLAGSDFAGTSCTATFESTSGVEVDIAGTTADLVGSNTRPTPGTYNHAYIKMSNKFGLRGTYEMNDTTFCSTASGGSDSSTGCSSVNFSERLVDFSRGGTCNSDEGDQEFSVSLTFSTGVTGTMKAKLANDSYVTSTSCGASTRLVGSFAPSTPITISDNTLGLEVDFTVTNTGMTIVPNDGGTAIRSFGSGPFRPRFSSY